MKNSLLKIAIFFFFLFFNQSLFAQRSSANNQQVVLEVSTITSKNYDEVKTALSGLTGVTLLAFCEQSTCFLLSYDSTLIESTDEILKVVNELHPSYKSKIKRNATIAEMVDGCNKFLASSNGTIQTR